MKTDYTRLAIFLAAIMFAALIFQRCTTMMVDAPANTVRAIREESAAAARDVAGFIKDVFNVTPQIYIRESMLSGQTAPIAEIAILEREFPYRMEWREKRLGSTKRLVIQGRFKAKAGFDLMRPFRIDMDPDTGLVSADLPAAEILSIEQVGQLVFEGESGLWNRLDDADRQAALQNFERGARQLIQSSDLTAEAERQSGARLQELADMNNREITFRFRSTD